jgi:hypothetical protein
MNNITVKLTKTEETGVLIGLKISFPEDFPEEKQLEVYRAFGEFLGAVLSPEEAAEFLRQYKAQMDELASRKPQDVREPA